MSLGGKKEYCILKNWSDNLGNISPFIDIRIVNAKLNFSSATNYAMSSSYDLSQVSGTFSAQSKPYEQKSE